MTTDDRATRDPRPGAAAASSPHDGHRAPSARRRPSRRLDTLAVVWWGAGAALAVTGAVTGRAGVGAAAVAPEALNSGLLRDVPDGPLTVGIAVFALLGALVAAWMRWGRTTSRGVRTATIAAAVVLLVGAVLLLDATILSGLGYLPAMLVLAPFSPAVRAEFSDYVEPAFLFQVVVLTGASLLAVTAIRYARRTARACDRCGRRTTGADPVWTTPASAARWGRGAALVAATIPAFYGVTRFAWAAGILLGLGPGGDGPLQGVGLVGAIGLGSFAVLGAVLTLGLYQRWGEVFPRWMLGLAGKRVPTGVAVVPAALVAVAVLPAGLPMIAFGVQQGLVRLPAEIWWAVGPAFLWPLWSVALGAAAYAYWLRRRGTCRACARG